MGAAIVGGLLKGGWSAESIAIVELADSQRARLTDMFPDVLVSHTVPRCSSALIAVKPHDVTVAVMTSVAAGAKRILSIAAGVPIDSLQEAAGNNVAVIRSMPNTPALVGQGAAAVCAGPTADRSDVEWARSVLSSVGIVVETTEQQMDAVTGVVGSGPAFLFLIAEAMVDAGVAAGLNRHTAETLVTQLFTGSAALLAVRGDAAGLRAMVTSPGGTTAAGLRSMEANGVRSAMIEAVLAATERSKELGHT